MEFIIVLPIYLVFLGMAFCYGELSLHGVNLAASGDRTVAMSHGGVGRTSFPSVAESVTSIAQAISPFSNRVDQAVQYHAQGTTEKVSQFDSSDCIGCVADTDIAGAWSWLVAATLKDNRALTPWTRGLALAWKGFTTSLELKDVDTPANDLFKVDSVGRVIMTSKPVSASPKAYAFYTLMRKPTGFEENSYRRWGTGWIVDASATWKRWVAEEKFPTKADGFDFADAKSRDGRGVPSTGHSATRPAYERYEPFVRWSE